MTLAPWLWILATVVAFVGGIGAVAWLIWDGWSPEQQALATALLEPSLGVLILAAIILLLVLSIGILALFRSYVDPLPKVTEMARMIAVSNPRLRLEAEGARAVSDVAAAINLLADRYQGLQDTFDVRIHEANAAVEEEKGTLAALVANLTQGVVVCNADDLIILYNRRARQLLESPSADVGRDYWLGLGRSIRGIIDTSLLAHALNHVQRRLSEGEAGLMVPFVANMPGQGLLSAHLVPILDRDRRYRGYVLTLDDITRRFGAEAQRNTELQTLIQNHRSAISGVRAAVESILDFPEMETGDRQQFLEVIRAESVRMGEDMSKFVDAYAKDINVAGYLAEIAAGDLLAAIQNALRDARNLDVEVTVPLGPIWVKADTYALIRCFEFLVDQILDACRAENLALTVEAKGGLVAIFLEWTGAALHPEALRRWGLRTVSADWSGQPLSLFEAIEHHGGAIWSLPQSPSGRPCLRLILPATEGLARPQTADAFDSQPEDFDLRMFDHSSHIDDVETALLGKLSYTVLDLETTGLEPSRGDEIIAIGAVRIVNGRILRREVFDSFVLPRVPIGAEARAVHGISMDMLRGAPPVEEVLPRFARFVGDTVLVGHNVSFDMRFLELCQDRTGVVLKNAVLDTLPLEIIVNPNVEHKTLDAIAGRLGVTVSGRHTALGDALTTAEVFLTLLPLLAERGITTLAAARAASQSTPYANLKY